MTRRRIDLVSEHANPLAVLGGVDAGGQNVHVAELAKGLARLGAEVVVHTRRDDPEVAEIVPLAPGVRVRHVRAGPARPVAKDDLLAYMPAFAAELTAWWRLRRPDIVHTHFWMSGFAGLRAAASVGVPVVHTFHALGVVKRRHQGWADTSPPERIGIERDLIAGMDRIIATCTDEVFELLRLGAESQRLAVVPCGVDVTTFTPDGPTLPRTPGRHRLVSIGRIVPRKGVGNAISALAGIPGAELFVAGGDEQGPSDPEVGRLLAHAAEVGVADRVRFLGSVPREEVPALLRSADLAICVPWYEPFGIVPLEAMACGVPVVAAAVGGLIDTVVNGVTGIHVPPREPAAIADAARILLSETERRAAMGEAGVARVRNRFTWQLVAAATMAQYDEVIAQRSVPTSIREAAR